MFIVWKVVRVTLYAGLRSVSTYPGLEYKEGIETIPEIEGSKLFAFSSLKDAESFRNDPDNQEIWEAEAPDSEIARWKTVVNAIRPHFENFWKTSGNTYYSLNSYGPPEGTVYCSSLKLLRKIS